MSIKSITVTIHEPDLADFLTDCSDVVSACEQYRAEYERRLKGNYSDAECSVILGQTNGMGDEIAIEFTTLEEEYSAAAENERPFIEDIANDMVNDWAWLTVA